MRARTYSFDQEKKQWVETPPPLAGTPKGDLYQIRRWIKERSFRKALRAIKRFEKKYDQNKLHEPDIWISRAQILVGQKKYDKAHKQLQQFLGSYSGSRLTVEALRLEFVIAEAYLGGAKRKFLGIKLFSAIELAYDILDDISTNYPSFRIAEQAIKTKADHLYSVGEYELAELEYAQLLNNFPQTRHRRFALRRTADAALSSFRGVEYDEAALIEANERYQDYSSQYPDYAAHENVDVILDDIRIKRSEKDLSIAQYYDRTEHFSSAVYSYRLVIKDYPNMIAAFKAARRLELLGIAVEPTETTASIVPPAPSGTNHD